MVYKKLMIIRSNKWKRSFMEILTLMSILTVYVIVIAIKKDRRRHAANEDGSIR